MKKTNQKPFARVIAKKIDVESIYKQMQQVLAQRKALQEKQDELWKVIKRNHCNRSSQMDSITNGIGKCTHKLNGLISNLCQYRKTHKAMGLANRYLQGEIGRINKIIQHQLTIFQLTHTKFIFLFRYIFRCQLKSIFCRVPCTISYKYQKQGVGIS